MAVRNNLLCISCSMELLWQHCRILSLLPAPALDSSMVRSAKFAVSICCCEKSGMNLKIFEVIIYEPGQVGQSVEISQLTEQSEIQENSGFCNPHAVLHLVHIDNLNRTLRTFANQLSNHVPPLSTPIIHQTQKFPMCERRSLFYSATS